jgi:hypothetical protein
MGTTMREGVAFLFQVMTTNLVGSMYSARGLGFGLGFETTDSYGANGMDKPVRTGSRHRQ